MKDISAASTPGGQPEPGERPNPKTRGLSRSWAYQQLAEIEGGTCHSALHEQFGCVDELRGPNVFDLEAATRPLRRETTEEEWERFKRLAEGERPCRRLSAKEIARILSARKEFTQYVVLAGPEPELPGPVRVPVKRVLPYLAGASAAEIAERSGIGVYTVRRIRRGERKTLRPGEVDRLLIAVGREDAYSQLVGSDEDEVGARLRELGEALRPILRVLAWASLRGEDDYTDEERAALADTHAMYGADYAEDVIPPFTPFDERDEIIRRLFRERTGRDPRPCPRRVLEQALAVLRAKQDDERERLEKVQKAVGRWPIDANRVGEWRRGARRAGYLPQRQQRDEGTMEQGVAFDRALALEKQRKRRG